MFDPETSPAPPAEPMPPADDAPPLATGGVLRAIGQFLRETFYTLFLTAALYILLNTITARIRVEGYSMVPTLQGGEFILVYRLAYRFGRQPQRGDIVVFRPQNNGLGGDYIKRVVGLPGDEVLIQNGTVYINNQPLYEPYILERPRYNGYWKVPPGHIFVLGDNRNHSTDSHILGPIPMTRVLGKAVVVYWPPSRVRVLRPEAPPPTTHPTAALRQR